MNLDEKIRFPIGRFEPHFEFTDEDRKHILDQIPEIAKTLRESVQDLKDEELRTPYRRGGWTITQIVHHLADNDMNAYIRFKRALTEEEPLASSYREDLWASLQEYKDLPLEDSIQLLEILHKRFLTLLRGLQSEQFNRKLRTEVLGTISLDVAIQRLVWHGQHHVAQIKSLKSVTEIGVLNQEGIYPHCPMEIRVVEVGGVSKPQLKHKLQQCSIRMNEYGNKLFDDEKFVISPTKRRLETVELSVRNLGFSDGATTLQLFQMADTLGLKLCPIDLGPFLRIQHLDQPETCTSSPEKGNQAPSGSLTIASEPLHEDDHFPKGFYLRNIEDELWLRGYIADDLHVWNPHDRIIFCRT
ncbi:putative damage-inducible protein DinB [Paenibacillus sp. 4624]